MKKTNNSGFSLVELIIVIAIMAVLIGVLAPQFIKYVESSRQSTDMQNVQELKTAIETYVAENGEKDDLAETIKIELSASSATISGMPDDDLKAVGLTGSTSLKSKGWSGSATYSTTTFTWDASGMGKNSKKPEKDMSGVFKTDAAGGGGAGGAGGEG